MDVFQEARCRQLKASAIEVSWTEGPGSSAPLYLERATPTGQVADGEIHAIKRL
ncbi:MAG: hypothetical protein R2706_05425 [Acidimicrobiales bacterium]